jgi:hypothetical protein
MAKFEYNWATAEMIKLYLRNSRAQAKRKARKAGGSTLASPGIGSIDRDTGANAGLSEPIDADDDSESDDDSDQD